MMLNRWTVIIFSIGIMFATYGACAQQDFNVVNTTTCSRNSFDHGSCTIKCSVTTNGTLNSWSWQYYATFESNNIVIYEAVQLTRTGDTYTSSLTLDDYNAGAYQCFFSFNDVPSPSFSATIKISKVSTGAPLYKQCMEDHDCNAMHATCSENSIFVGLVCQCIGQYNMTYDSGANTPACLKLQPEGGHCYSQWECNWPTQSYSCIDNRCNCTGNMTEVNIDGTETEICIQPAYLNDDCYYDEQCELTTEHSYCYEDRHDGKKYCDCEKRYSMGYGISYEDNYCYYTGLEGWQIACIVLGTVGGVAFIGSTIYYLVRKSKKNIVSSNDDRK